MKRPPMRASQEIFTNQCGGLVIRGASLTDFDYCDWKVLLPECLP